MPARRRLPRPARYDPEYTRGGVVNLFLATEPRRGWRSVLVSDQRTRLDFARCVKDLVDVHYPAAEKIVLVPDQLDTHSPASLYAAFPPAEAQRLAEKLEVHHTPKHGSWLNMAELELAVLQRRCLNRRLRDRAELKVAAWAARRNAAASTIDWQFTTADVRTKLRRLYRAFDAPLVGGRAATSCIPVELRCWPIRQLGGERNQSDNADPNSPSPRGMIDCTYTVCVHLAERGRSHPRRERTVQDLISRQSRRTETY